MRLFISKLILELVICHGPVAVHAATDKSVYSDTDINLELKSASSATLQVPVSYKQNQRKGAHLVASPACASLFDAEEVTPFWVEADRRLVQTVAYIHVGLSIYSGQRGRSCINAVEFANVTANDEKTWSRMDDSLLTEWIIKYWKVTECSIEATVGLLLDICMACVGRNHK